jgi:hypothetical protein
MDTRGEHRSHHELKGLLGVQMKLQMDLKHHVQSFEEVFMLDPLNK